MNHLTEVEYEERGLHHAEARGRKIRDRRASHKADESIKAWKLDRPGFLPRSRKERRALRMKRTL